MAKLNISDKPVSNIPVLPVGTYPGVVSAIWDIGIQESEYQGETKQVHQLLIRVEVNKLIEAEGEYKGKRYAPISWITVPRSYSDLSNLVKLCNAVFKRTTTANEYGVFDTDTLLGGNVTVNVGVTTGGKAKITGFSPAMEGMPVLTPELDATPQDWVIEQARKCIGEYKPAVLTESEAPKPDVGDGADQLPF